MYPSCGHTKVEMAIMADARTRGLLATATRRAYSLATLCADGEAST